MRRIIVLVFVLSLSYFSHAQAPVLVQDINTAYATASANPTSLIEYKGAMYFFADDGAHDIELWKYDESGPASMVYDLNTTGVTIEGGAPPMVIYQDKLYFGGKKAGVNTLYVYDSINPPAEAPGLSGFAPSGRILDLTVAGSNLYFTCQTDKTTGFNDLYVYDGTSTPVKINLPNPMVNPGPAPQDLIGFHGKLYFTSYESVSKIKMMFQLDPATNNFSLLTTSLFLGGFATATNKFVSGAEMYFGASADTAGLEVYLFDGTNATRLTNTPNSAYGGAKGPFAVYAGSLYYTANIGGAAYSELYKCPATSQGGTLLMTDGPIQPKDLVVYKNKLYFTGTSNSAGSELWQHDATGTKMAADIRPGSTSSRNVIGTSIVFNNHLYFNANDGVHGNELFRLDDPTDVRSMKLQSRVQVYPNPSSHTVTMQISLDEARSLAVTITDVSGRQIYSSGSLNLPSGESELVLPLQSFVPGQYFYSLTGQNGQLLASGVMLRQ